MKSKNFRFLNLSLLEEFYISLEMERLKISEDETVPGCDACNREYSSLPLELVEGSEVIMIYQFSKFISLLIEHSAKHIFYLNFFNIDSDYQLYYLIIFFSVIYYKDK